MTQYSKREIVAAFSHLASQKPIDRIRVREIVEACGLNRNTFYYYFSDLYALSEWVLVSVSEQAAAYFRETGSLTEALKTVACWIDENRALFRNLTAALGRERTEQALFSMAEPLILRALGGESGEAARKTKYLRYVLFGLFFDALQGGSCAETMREIDGFLTLLM